VGIGHVHDLAIHAARRSESCLIICVRQLLARADFPSSPKFLASAATLHSGSIDIVSPTAMHEPYLHFTRGDALWFAAWTPQSRGAVGATCIGLVLLAMFQRLLAGVRDVLETVWRVECVRDAQLDYFPLPRLTYLVRPWQCRARHIAVERRIRSTDLPRSTKPHDATGTSTPSTAVQTTPKHRSFVLTTPFIPSHDLGRGLAFTCETAVSFLLLLAVW